MPFSIQTSRVLTVAAPVAFDRLADQESWRRWMPRSFRPVGAPVGRLREGETYRVRVSGLPAVSIRVTVVRRSQEIAWTGGVRGVFFAAHHFYFEPRGEAEVEVRSVETWSGVLATALQGRMKEKAEEVLRDQLAALAESLVR
jgi:hypothetical protein